MMPKILCRKCGAEILPSDKFCGSCGLRISWPDADRTSPPAAPKGGAPVCPHCGSQNIPGAAFCESCGSSLGVQPKQKQPRTPPQQPLSFFQSWKLTAIIGVILIGVIILFKTSRKEQPEPAAPAAPQTAAMMSQIETLERAVEAHPTDTLAVLHLANLLYDARLFPRAALMYDRYLKANPANADARVDMGVAYFEMSFLDSLKAGEYISTAAREMEKALDVAPNHQLACFNLGIISFHTGDNERALGWFKRCVAIDPNSETGKRAQQFFTQHQFTK
jgi:ribosomal protein L40E